MNDATAIFERVDSDCPMILSELYVFQSKLNSDSYQFIMEGVCTLMIQQRSHTDTYF